MAADAGGRGGGKKKAIKKTRKKAANNKPATKATKDGYAIPKKHQGHWFYGKQHNI